ncbi:MAG: hypothetical protein WBA41_05730 [Rivularia sp. (in: cyanobacteria)]
MQSADLHQNNGLVCIAAIALMYNRQCRVCGATKIYFFKLSNPESILMERRRNIVNIGEQSQKSSDRKER